MILSLIKNKYIWILLPEFCFFTVRGTSPAKDRYDFDFPTDTLGWIASGNASRLYELSINRSGRAFVSGSFANGALNNFNTASSATGFRALGESWYRLAPQTMLYGAASFESGYEKDVAGSLFMPREERAFDIVLNDPENRGDRKTEWYHIEASVGHRINRLFSVGGRIDYQAGNMTRTKDLRHTNKTLDLQSSLGTSLRINDRLNTGIHYSYKRYIEGMSFKTYGNTDKQYFSLIDFGGFFGKQELFDKNGYTGSSESNPYVENTHELGWQLEYKPTERISFFNELSLGRGNGYYGKKSSSSILYTEHNLSYWQNRILAVYRGNRFLHTIDIRMKSFALDNYENSWRTETSSSGIQIIEYYGQNQVGEKKHAWLSGEYLLEWKQLDSSALWRISAGAGFGKRTVGAVLYPYVRNQQLQLYEQHLGVLHQRNAGSIELAIHASLSVSSGKGDPFTDGVIVPLSSGEGAPVTNETYLLRHYDYLTRTGFNPEAGLRITWPVKDMAYYARLDYSNEHKTENSAQSANRHLFRVALGVNF